MRYNDIVVEMEMPQRFEEGDIVVSQGNKRWGGTMAPPPGLPLLVEHRRDNDGAPIWYQVRDYFGLTSWRVWPDGIVRATKPPEDYLLTWAITSYGERKGKALAKKMIDAAAK